MSVLPDFTLPEVTKEGLEEELTRLRRVINKEKTSDTLLLESLDNLMTKAKALHQVQVAMFVMVDNL